MFFSVIIPVYNVLPYLREAVDSVLTQDFKGEFEVILVDDGSTDGSGAVCDEYAKQEVSQNIKIKVIHKPNGGLSSARNAGLDVAKGEYIVFLDSDDWLELESLKTFYVELSKDEIDVLTFSYRRVFLDKVVEESKKKCETNKVLTLEQMLKTDWLGSAGCSQVYSRNLIEQNKLRFIEGIFHEDEPFMAQVVSCARRVVAVDYVALNYRIRSDSIMQCSDTSHLQKRLSDFIFVVKKIREISFSASTETRRDAIRRRALYMSWFFFLNIDDLHLTSPLKKRFFAEMRQNRFYPYVVTSSNVRFRFYWLLIKIHCPFCVISFIYHFFPFEHPIWNGITRVIREIRSF